MTGLLLWCMLTATDACRDGACLDLARPLEQVFCPLRMSTVSFSHLLECLSHAQYLQQTSAWPTAAITRRKLLSSIARHTYPGARMTPASESISTEPNTVLRIAAAKTDARIRASRWPANASSTSPVRMQIATDRGRRGLVVAYEAIASFVSGPT